MNREQVKEVLRKAKSVNVMGIHFVNCIGLDEICMEYNGIGPQFLPEKLRDKVTSTLSTFEPAALVHDLRFAKSDGSRESFDYANNEFVVNCRKCAKAKYPWWSWKRYRAYAVIDAMDRFNCSDGGGWRAWLDAHAARAKD